MPPLVLRALFEQQNERRLSSAPQRRSPLLVAVVAFADNRRQSSHPGPISYPYFTVGGGESANKLVVQSRMKGAGMRWNQNM